MSTRGSLYTVTNLSSLGLNKGEKIGNRNLFTFLLAVELFKYPFFLKSIFKKIISTYLHYIMITFLSGSWYLYMTHFNSF